MIADYSNGLGDPSIQEELTPRERDQIWREGEAILEFLGLTRGQVVALCRRHRGNCPTCGRPKPGSPDEEKGGVSRRGNTRHAFIPVDYLKSERV